MWGYIYIYTPIYIYRYPYIIAGDLPHMTAFFLCGYYSLTMPPHPNRLCWTYVGPCTAPEIRDFFQKVGQKM